jgi:transcriptional regulator with XRE-family HTH domain
MQRKRVSLRVLGQHIKNQRKKFRNQVTYSNTGEVILPKKGITQQELADLLNVSLESVKNWEQGYNYPTYEMLLEIANFLNCSMDYLFGLQEYPFKFESTADTMGLSEKAYENLHFAGNQGKQYLELLSNLLEDEYFLYQLSEAQKSPEIDVNRAFQQFTKRVHQ